MKDWWEKLPRETRSFIKTCLVMLAIWLVIAAPFIYLCLRLLY